jgi:hypothetical protein
MYPLIEFTGDDGSEHAVMQGRVSSITCARRTDCGAFVDQLLLPENEGDSEFHVGRHRVRRRVAAHQIGLVSRKATVLAQLSVRENIALLEPAGPARMRFWRAVDQALEDTGLLAGVDPGYIVSGLPWHIQVEINFLQMWLRHPECMLFDRVYEHDDADNLLHLPALYRRRYPLRAVCYLQRGALPAGLGVTDVVHL